MAPPRTTLPTVYVALADNGCLQCLGDLVRPRIEIGVRHGAFAERQCRPLRLLRGVSAGDVGQSVVHAFSRRRRRSTIDTCVDRVVPPTHTVRP
jgi:hypothetical protein